MNEKNEMTVEKCEIENITEAAAVQTPVVIEDSEFKVTVRKLEMPVRPRGVLAE